MSTFIEIEDEHGTTHEVARRPQMDERPATNPMFDAIPSLKTFDGAEYILKRAKAYDDEDAYLEEAGMFMDDLVYPVSLHEVIAWVASAPDQNLEYANEYLLNYADTKDLPTDATQAVLFGGLWVALEWYLVACFDELKEKERLPWQTRCSYCEDPDSGEARKDRIGERSCKHCWDEAVDGPWV